MIEASKLMKSLGKEKFTQFVLNNKDKEKTGHELAHQKRWGKVTSSYCANCRKWVKRDEYCKCSKIMLSKAPWIKCDSHEYFNLGTGTYGTTSEHRKYAKLKGLRESG